MEAYFIANGPYHAMELFEAHMQSQLFALKGTDPKGNPIQQDIFGILEPVKLYRYIFPQEAKNLVLPTLGAKRKNATLPTMALWSIKKALGLKDVNADELPNVSMPVKIDNIHLAFLGIREDDVRTDKTTGVTQEMI